MRGSIRSEIRCRALWLVAIAIALAAIPSWGTAQTDKAPLEYERTTASAALSALEQQLAQLGLPENVQRWLDVGRAQTERLLASDEPAEARRHFRKATRAFARISRWLREAEVAAVAEASDAARTPEERRARLRTRLARMDRELARLSKRAEALGVSLNDADATALAGAAKSALEKSNPRAGKEALKQLKRALDELQEALDDAVEAAGDKGGQR